MAAARRILLDNFIRSERRSAPLRVRLNWSPESELSQLKVTTNAPPTLDFCGIYGFYQDSSEQCRNAKERTVMVSLAPVRSFGDSSVCPVRDSFFGLSTLHKWWLGSRKRFARECKSALKFSTA